MASRVRLMQSLQGQTVSSGHAESQMRRVAAEAARYRGRHPVQSVPECRLVPALCSPAGEDGWLELAQGLIEAGIAEVGHRQRRGMEALCPQPRHVLWGGQVCRQAGGEGFERKPSTTKDDHRNCGKEGTGQGGGTITREGQQQEPHLRGAAHQARASWRHPASSELLAPPADPPPAPALPRLSQ